MLSSDNRIADSKHTRKFAIILHMQYPSQLVEPWVVSSTDSFYFNFTLSVR